MLFKILQGSEKNLPSTLTPGYCYFLKDKHYFYVDYLDSNGNNARAKLSAEYADKLRYYENNTIVELDPRDIPLRDELIKKVLLTQAEYDALPSKDPNTLYIITDAPEDEEEGSIIRTELTVSANNTSSIAIPASLSEFENIMVYQNGILLIEGVHYNKNGLTISLIDYTANSGDTFTFINKEISAEAKYAESWAVGGTGLRTDEDTNNSKYWAEFAQSVSSVADAVKYTEQTQFTPAEKLVARNNIENQLSSLPTASANYANHIIQYVGTTDASYKNGYFYKCVNTSGSAYTWEVIDFVLRSELEAAINELKINLEATIEEYIGEVLESEF